MQHRAMGQENKTTHTPNTYQIINGPVNAEHLWETSVCKHFEPNIASVVQKFTPSSLSLHLASNKDHGWK